jgi:hypothetical protein
MQQSVFDFRSQIPAGAACFALGNVLNREALPMPPLVVAAWQVGLGCFRMLVLGVVFAAFSASRSARARSARCC